MKNKILSNVQQLFSRSNVTKLLLLAIISSVSIFLGCQKNQIEGLTEIKVQKEMPMALASSAKTPNPFSVTSIQKALADLGRSDALENDRIYYYYAFNPNNMTGDMLKIVEADENHHILDFPFADGDTYKPAFTNNCQASIDAAKDGNLYIVFKKGSSLESLFQYNGQLGASKLDELYLPKENDEDLQIQAMANAENVTPAAFKISWPCLFKRVHGKVQYMDQQTGTGVRRPVPNMQVWALAFGIPIPTWTDAGGNYEVPWLFSVGTIVGTHAKNYLVKVMQNAFHELAHASLFRQVGDIYWEEVIANIVITKNSSCGNYGCGTEFGAGKASLNEAWAEYLGKEHHRRLHLTGQALTDALGWRSYPEALERDMSFQQDWIPTGVFFDLRDPFNSISAFPEPSDQIEGFSISQMYSVFSPNTHNFCDYRDRFIQTFPTVTLNQFNDVLFMQNAFTGCNN